MNLRFPVKNNKEYAVIITNEGLEFSFQKTLLHPLRHLNSQKPKSIFNGICYGIR